jgi:hypothetical protein
MHLYIYEHVRTNIHIHSITCWNLIVSKVWSICTMLQWSAFLLMNFICIVFYEENHRDLDSNPLILFILWAFNFEVPTISLLDMKLFKTLLWIARNDLCRFIGASSVSFYKNKTLHFINNQIRSTYWYIDKKFRTSVVYVPIAWLWVIILVCLLEKTIKGFKRN